jgi:hypothetical protein
VIIVIARGTYIGIHAPLEKGMSGSNPSLATKQQIKIMKIYSCKNGKLFIDSVQQFFEGYYLCGTPYKHEATTTIAECLKANILQNVKWPHRVRNCMYNGFFGRLDPGYKKYKARFKEWTMDPGIAIFYCSDGKEREIPSFAVTTEILLPKRIIPKGEAIIFGNSIANN